MTEGQRFRSVDTMQRKDILARLQSLAALPELEKGFKSQRDCLDWANKVAPLLTFNPQYHGNFLSAAHTLNFPVSAQTTQPAFSIMRNQMQMAIEELSAEEGSSSSTVLDMTKIFVSHSGNDLTLAELVVSLMRSALTLSAREILCTSVDGHRLPAGADTDEHLRREVLVSPVFVGLISQSSFESAYVLFELGARWGAGKQLIPLLAPGFSAASLKGPIAGLNALTCENAAQLHQFVTEVARTLSISPEQPAAYQKIIDAIVSFKKEPSGTSSPVAATSALAIPADNRGTGTAGPSAGSARVTVRLTRGHAGTSVVISNSGPADASDVSLTFANSECPVLRDEMSRKLPIPSLPVDAEVQLIAATSCDVRPPFHARLEWKDSTGRQSKAFMLT